MHQQLEKMTTTKVMGLKAAAATHSLKRRLGFKITVQMLKDDVKERCHDDSSDMG